MISETIRSMCGRWRPRNSSVLFEITAKAETLSVRAVDIDDGEELDVLELEWDEDSIRFTMVTPSTDWTVYNELRPDEYDTLSCSTTIFDRCERAT